MKLLRLLLIGSTAGMLGACAKDEPETIVSHEISPAPSSGSTSANTTLEEEELQEKLSRLSDSLKALADKMGEHVEKGGASAKKDMAAIEVELEKVGTMLRQGAEDSEKTGRKSFGRVVDEMDHLVKRMKETLD